MAKKLVRKGNGFVVIQDINNYTITLNADEIELLENALITYKELIRVAQRGGITDDPEEEEEASERVKALIDLIREAQEEV